MPEIPPEQRPDGDNVQWIPGHWAWDEERKRFYLGERDVPRPAGRTYVPGYWSRHRGRLAVGPGLLTGAQAESPQYVPEPPASLDIDPASPPPDENSFYAPRNWVYQRRRHLAAGILGAVPARLRLDQSWSPGGCFCNGYWDYPFQRRGLLFAPIELGGGWGPGWGYRPVRGGRLARRRFWRPGRPFYYYDLFRAELCRQGFRPWFKASGPGRRLLSLAEPIQSGWAGGHAAVVSEHCPRAEGPRPLRITSIANLGGGPGSTGRAHSNSGQTANVQAFRQRAEQRSRVETRAKAVGNGSPPRVANVSVRPSEVLHRRARCRGEDDLWAGNR